MTLDQAAITAGLRSVWPEVEVKTVQELTGGEWATMVRLGVAGVPDGVPDDLVLRVAPTADMGAKEIAVQRAVAAAGVPTPRIHAAGPAGGSLRGAWAVMDFVDGTSLLSGLDGFNALRQVGPLLRGLPAQLATTMAAVHRIDPGPVVEQVRAVSPEVALSVAELLEHLAAGARGLGDSPLAAALEWLQETRPTQGEEVLCHGDIHPFNLLAVGNEVVVLDWTAAVVAPPAYDVAFTSLLLRYPPLAAPAPLRPLIGVAAVAMSRRFVRSYREARPATDLSDLPWFSALQSARVLIDLAIWEQAGDPRARHHPWRLVAPGARRILERVSGVRC